MIDDRTYFQSDGRTPSGVSGAAVWSGTPVVDRRRRLLYVTTGNTYSLPSGDTTVPDGDHAESIVALDLDTGAIRWSTRATPDPDDVFNYTRLATNPPHSEDWDFGAGANLFRAVIGGVPRDLVGAGQKSGMYWAVDADTGRIVWNTQVGPGGHLGGIHWGTAVDGARIYVGVNDGDGTAYTLGGRPPLGGQTTTVGSWAALDPATGEILWQTANPAMTAALGGTTVNGPVSVANGVMFGGSMDAQGTMLALDAATGGVLWSFASGGTVYAGPAIANGMVYWGNGYPASRLGFGTPGGRLYAFRVP
jgi:polyvinyl alcohol dehydrogenase (cytochrome)